jgi:anti-anti-sigma factor
MAEQPYRHLTRSLTQGVLVLTVQEQQLRSDEVAEDLGKEMLDALATAKVNKVAINLRTVQYMSSVGFRPLLQVFSRLKDNGGGRIVLCHLAPAVQEVLHVTHLISPDGRFRAPFEEQPDVAAAVTALTAPAAT